MLWSFILEYQFFKIFKFVFYSNNKTELNAFWHIHFLLQFSILVLKMSNYVFLFRLCFRCSKSGEDFGNGRKIKRNLKKNLWVILYFTVFHMLCFSSTGLYLWWEKHVLLTQFYWWAGMLLKCFCSFNILTSAFLMF